MRLIDADSLKAYFKNFYSDREDVVEMLWGDVDFQPTVDPVKHGHWIKRNSVGTATCSVCGGLIMNFYNKDANTYCHNCGAKMDGDKGGID